jgi:hypothetical protein
VNCDETSRGYNGRLHGQLLSVIIVILSAQSIHGCLSRRVKRSTRLLHTAITSCTYACEAKQNLKLDYHWLAAVYYRY